MRFIYEDLINFADYSRAGIEVLHDNEKCYFIGEDWSLNLAHIFSGWSDHPLTKAFELHHKFLICEIKSSTPLYIAKLVSSLVLL